MLSAIHYAPASANANFSIASSSSFSSSSSSPYSQRFPVSSRPPRPARESAIEDHAGRQQPDHQRSSHGHHPHEPSTSPSSSFDLTPARISQSRSYTSIRTFVGPNTPLDAAPPGLWTGSPPSMFTAEMLSYHEMRDQKLARVEAEDGTLEAYAHQDQADVDESGECQCNGHDTEQPPFRFLDLPPEIRELIYPLILSPRIKPLTETHHSLIYELCIMQTCKLAYAEAHQIFRRQNMFVSIETPWVQAEQHAEVEGCVPIMAKEKLAERFTGHHFRVIIEAPEMMHSGGLCKFIIRLEDLHRFCRMWYYSDLTHIGLNNHLAVKLVVRNPAKLFPELDNDAELKHRMPKWAQEELFRPFGMIKDLFSFKVEGECYPELVQKMKDEMAVPYDSPEKCLDEADRLKTLGNDQLKLGNFEAALEQYVKAFAAIHILVDGRHRRICGDAYFEKDLQGGKYDGQHGGIVRMVVRIKLVANVIQAYLKMELWEEAHYWGMRSINLMRQALGGSVDVPRPSFPAASEWGKIYYRTGMAAKRLDLMSDARELLKIAGQWLPSDEFVQREITATALRIE